MAETETAIASQDHEERREGKYLIFSLAGQEYGLAIHTVKKQSA